MQSERIKDLTPHLCNTGNAYCFVGGSVALLKSPPAPVHLNDMPATSYSPSKFCLPFASLMTFNIYSLDLLRH